MSDDEIERKITYDGRGCLPGIGLMTFVRDTWFDADSKPHTHYYIEVQEEQYNNAKEEFLLPSVARGRMND